MGLPLRVAISLNRVRIQPIPRMFGSALGFEPIGVWVITETRSLCHQPLSLDYFGNDSKGPACGGEMKWTDGTEGTAQTVQNVGLRYYQL